MEENKTVNQEANVTPGENGETPAKTFTQDEVNKIVADRISRERSKYSDFEALKDKASKYDEIVEADKSELQKANERAEKLESELTAIKEATAIKEVRLKVAKETGVPEALLTGTTEEACMAQANAINDYAKPTGYPTTTDGGETKPPTMSKADIMAIKDNKARLKAIEENIELFS